MIPGPPWWEQRQLRECLSADSDARAVAYCLKESVILKRLDKGWVFLDEKTGKRILFWHPPTGEWVNGESEGVAEDLWFAVDVALEIQRAKPYKPVQGELAWEKKRKRKGASNGD